MFLSHELNVVSTTPQRSNLILRGHFNPYIFSPEWLISIGLIQQDAEINLNLGALGDGVKFECDGTVWRIEPNVFTVDTSASANDLGQIGQRILNELCHTPITAVGFNFQYKLETNVEWLIPSIGNMPVNSIEGFPPVVLSKWGVVFHDEKTRVELSVSTGDQGVVAVFNFHTPIVSENLIGSAKLASEFCNAFEDAKNRSNELLSKVLINEESCTKQ